MCIPRSRFKPGAARQSLAGRARVVCAFSGAGAGGRAARPPKSLGGLKIVIKMRCAMVSMAERLFIVYLNGAPDPMDRAYHQPVRASHIEVSDGYLVFTNADGELCALFALSAVRNWREADKSELQE